MTTVILFMSLFSCSPFTHIYALHMHVLGWSWSILLLQALHKKEFPLGFSCLLVSFPSGRKYVYWVSPQFWLHVFLVYIIINCLWLVVLFIMYSIHMLTNLLYTQTHTHYMSILNVCLCVVASMQLWLPTTCVSPALWRVTATICTAVAVRQFLKFRLHAQLMWLYSLAQWV